MMMNKMIMKKRPTRP